MALTVCLSAFYVCLKHYLWGRVGSTDGFFARKPALNSRRLYDTNILLDVHAKVLLHVRRTADASRLRQGFRAKEPSVDPTRQVNMSVFLHESLHCQLARRSAKIQQEAELSPRDRAMRRVS